MRLTFRSYVLAVACGVMLALSFPTWHIYPIAWVALAPLFFLAHRLRPVDTFALFLVAGWTFYSLLLQWLVTNIYWAGGWAIWGYQLLCVYMALYWGLLGLLWSWLHARSPRYCGALAAAALWAAMEYAQGALLTGFGWGTLGYSQGKDILLFQWAALGGIGVVSAILVCFNVLLALVFAEPRLRLIRALGAIAVLAVSHGVGALLIRDADYEPTPLRVGVVQSNFPLEMKWDGEYTEEMVRNAAQKSQWLAQYEPLDLLVWPESLVMDPLDQSPPLLEIVSALARNTQCAVFTGSIRIDEKTGAERNSSFLLDTDGALVDHYDKIHLAPFGEYVPLREYLPFVGRIVPTAGDIEPGNVPKVLPVAQRRLGPLICFEVLFPELAERLRARDADLLVVITNLAWFGSSSAIAQELEIARARAVETRLPLVHCANSGISGVFDPWGRFSAVNTTFDSMGRYVEFQNIDPMGILMWRCAGAFSVAAPGHPPVPYGPRIFPWLAIAVSILVLILAAFFPKRGDDSPNVFVRR